MTLRAALLIACAACSSSGEPAPTPSPAVAPAPVPPSNAPIGVPADQRAHVAAIERGLLPPVTIKGEEQRFALADHMAQYGVPAVSVAAFEHGAILWAKAWGTADADAKTPATETTLFQAGSISKPVNALAQLLAVRAGKLTLDGPINASLTSWKLPDNDLTRKTPVTLRMLLSHTAGTTVHGFSGYAAGEPVPTLVQVLAGAPPANSAPIVVDLPPGTQERYSGGGIEISQLALTDQYARPYADILADTVLGPIGMAHSTFEQPLPAARVADAAAGHDHGAPIPGKRHTYPEQAAAGLWTTPTDLARFLIEIQRGRAGTSAIVPQEVAREMTTPSPPSLGGLGVGLLDRGTAKLFAHGGVDEGFESYAIASRDGGYGVVVMTNGKGGSRLAEEVARAVFAEYGWPSPDAPLVRAHLAAKELGALTGTLVGWHHLEGAGATPGDGFEIALAGDQLAIHRPFQPPHELVAIAADEVVDTGDGEHYVVAAGGALIGTPARSDKAPPITAARVSPEDAMLKIPLVELEAGREVTATFAEKALVRATPAIAAAEEARVNALGYDVMTRGDAAQAVALFKLNVAVFPASANALDSLGDGYVSAGDKANAITAFRAALAALPHDAAIAPELRKSVEQDAREQLAKLGAK